MATRGFSSETHNVSVTQKVGIDGWHCSTRGGLSRKVVDGGLGFNG